MRILSLILALAIAASTIGSAEVAAAPEGDEHACCKSQESQKEKESHDCGGACLLTCCRTVTAPADPLTTALDQAPLAIRMVLPPLLADDLGEPQSIFHPPRV